MKGALRVKSNNIVKRVLDVTLTAALLLLMAFQVTEQLMHEWLGVAMFALTILHNVLNRRYYAAIFRGKYSPLRIFRLVVNILLALSFVCTALSGMIMSRFATPFMNGTLPPSVVRQGHLALSHWSFVLMGLHLGLHFGTITSKVKKKAVIITLGAAAGSISVYGFYLFFKANFFDYMFFRAAFAMLDYDKAWWLVILENLIMLLAWGFAAYLLSLVLKTFRRKNKIIEKGEKS